MQQIQTGWRKQDIITLFSKVSKAKDQQISLNSVFNEMAQITNRKPNSVRNFYYNFLCLLHNSTSLQKEYGISADKFQKVQFETFNQSEIDLLVEHILVEYNKGKSVRKILYALADGDKQKMLRFQNKYRSMIANHPQRVDEIMRKLEEKGTSYHNPYGKKIVKENSAIKNDIYSNMCFINEQIKSDNSLNLYLLLNLSQQMVDNIVQKINCQALVREK